MIPCILKLVLYYHVQSIRPQALPNHHKILSSSGHCCWLYIIYSIPDDPCEFIRVTPFLRPLRQMSMWPHLTNEMQGNIFMMTQAKPQEERLSCPPRDVITSGWNPWNCHSLLVLVPAWEWWWHGMAELTGRESVALRILNQRSLEPSCSRFPCMWDGRCPYCWSKLDSCFYLLQQYRSWYQTLLGAPRG